MKTLNLNAYGVQEMNAVELNKTDGGNPVVIFIAGAIAGGIIYDAVKYYVTEVVPKYGGDYSAEMTRGH